MEEMKLCSLAEVRARDETERWATLSRERRAKIILGGAGKLPPGDGESTPTLRIPYYVCATHTADNALFFHLSMLYHLARPTTR